MAATERIEEEMKIKSAKDLKNATDPVEKLRLSLLSKGANGIKGISRKFRIMDDDGNKQLSLEEFKKGVQEAAKDISNDDIQSMFDRFDADKSGSISFDEFLVQIRGPMSESRKTIIKKAFDKLDKTGDGVVTVEDLRGVYNVRDHPKFRNGQWSEEKVFLEYLKNFDSPNDPDGKVTFEEFMNYYCGISAGIDSDAYFDLMMRNAWKI